MVLRRPRDDKFIILFEAASQNINEDEKRSSITCLFVRRSARRRGDRARSTSVRRPERTGVNAPLHGENTAVTATHGSFHVGETPLFVGDYCGLCEE